MFFNILGSSISRVTSDAARLLMNTASSPNLNISISTRFRVTFTVIFISLIEANTFALFLSLRYAKGISASASKNKMNA